MTSFSLATWNVNSIKIRLPHLLAWLRADKPDIVLLQEIKCVNEAFPSMEIEELGYNLAVHGEKTYNGVAILSKFPLEDIRRGLPGNEDDAHARYVEAVVNIGNGQRATGHGGNSSPLPFAYGPSPIIRVASVYVPNGQDANSEKFPYKLRFLERLHAHVRTLLAYEEMLAIGGDYNIAPDDIDVHEPRMWEGSVLTHREVRTRLRKILNLGVYDAFRLACPAAVEYSWWDYRAGAFEKDLGLRIDHVLLSPQAADRLCGSRIIKSLRGLEKASDHTPVVAEFSL